MPIRMRSLGLTKRSKCLLLKKYFDNSFKVKSGSLWSILPQECREIIRDFERQSFFVSKIQRHWHKVRYAPGEAPPFQSMKMQTVYVTEPSGYRRCTYRYINQRAVIHWHGSWEGAQVSKAGGGGLQPANQTKKPWQYYTAKLYGDSTSSETGREIYYYDLDKRMTRLNVEYARELKTFQDRVKRGLSIEGWSVPSPPGLWPGKPVLIPFEPTLVVLIKPW